MDTELQDALIEYADKGWIVISQSDTSAQIKYPKTWNKPLLAISAVLIIIGILFFPLLAIGIVVLVLAVIDYLIKPEKNHLLTVDQIKNGTAPPAEFGFKPVGVIILVIVVVGLCYLYLKVYTIP